MQKILLVWHLVMILDIHDVVCIVDSDKPYDLETKSTLGNMQWWFIESWNAILSIKIAIVPFHLAYHGNYNDNPLEVHLYAAV